MKPWAMAPPPIQSYTVELPRRAQDGVAGHEQDPLGGLGTGGGPLDAHGGETCRQVVVGLSMGRHPQSLRLAEGTSGVGGRRRGQWRYTRERPTVPYFQSSAMSSPRIPGISNDIKEPSVDEEARTPKAATRRPTP